MARLSRSEQLGEPSRWVTQGALHYAEVAEAEPGRREVGRAEEEMMSTSLRCHQEPF